MSLDEAVAVNATAVLEPDDGPSPDPNPSQRSPLGMFFSGTPAEEVTSPILLSSDLLSGDGSASDVGEPTDLDESPPETGPPASSADGLLSKAQLRTTFRTGIQVGTVTAHRLGARTPGQVAVGLYLADEDDQKGIGDPLANIAYRRGGLAGGQLSPDTNDFLQAVMGIAGYIAKQVRGVQDARQIDAQHTAGVRPDLDGESA